MKGIISNYRSSRHRQTDNQMIVVVKGIDTREKAKSLIGKKVVYKTESNNEILGKINFTHGNKGALRVLFEKGMPGQSISKNVDIL